jgi:hypothetical protein
MAVDSAFNTQLSNIAQANDTLDQAAYHVVTWADVRAPDDVLKLVEAARGLNDSHRELQAIAEYIKEKRQQIEVNPVAGQPPLQAPGALERTLHSVADFVDVLQFKQRMSQCEAAVCRIEMKAGEGEGTGFLVGPNLVLTNYHVFCSVWKRQTTPDEVVARFDYKIGPDGVSLPAGRACKLTADWNVAHSASGEGAEDLDFLLLRLNESPGTDSMAELAGAPRGWLRPALRKLQKGEPLVILQHPLTRPMQLALGSVIEINTLNSRVAYDVNTEPGSSGSPCFDAQWDLVALHYYGAKTANRGMILGAILAQIQPWLT